MKSYLRNKNFIPRKYVKNQDFKKNKGNKRGIIYLILINIIIFPISIDKIFKKEKIKAVEIVKPVGNNVEIESIIKWINEIDSEIVNLEIKNNSGVMVVKSIEKIYSLEEKGDNINRSISKNESGYYRVEVISNSKKE